MVQLQSLKKYDLFKTYVIDNDSYTVLGFLVSYTILPALLLTFTIYTAVTLSNETITVTKTKILEKNTPVYIGFLCEEPKFCIIVTSCEGKNDVYQLSAGESLKIKGCFTHQKSFSFLVLPGQSASQDFAGSACSSSIQCKASLTYLLFTIGSAGVAPKYKIFDDSGSFVSSSGFNQFFLRRTNITQGSILRNSSYYYTGYSQTSTECLSENKLCKFFGSNLPGSDYHYEPYTSDLSSLILKLLDIYGVKATADCLYYNVNPDSISCQKPVMVKYSASPTLETYVFINNSFDDEVVSYNNGFDIAMKTISATGGMYGIIFAVLSIILSVIKKRKVATPTKQLP